MTSTRREAVAFLTRRTSAEVLVAHRQPKLGSFWHPISGCVKQGETYDEAARRELREETGLRVGALTQCETRDFVYGDGVRVRCFLLEVDDDFEPALNWEHDDYRWCTFGEAVELLHWPSLKDALLGFAALPLAA